jgi:hypothetical protein
MFAKLARLHLFGRSRQQILILTAAPSNDNRPVRRLKLHATPVPRRVLACRWHQVAGGRLECSWALVPGASADDMRISRFAA